MSGDEVAVPTADDMAAAAQELTEIAHAVATMPVPLDQASLDKVQPRLAAVAADVASWHAVPIITSPEPMPELPEPLRIIHADPGSLGRILAEGRSAGDRIVLAVGEYSGNLTLSGPRGLQVVAAEPLVARILGDVKLTGEDIILSGVDLSHRGKRSGASVIISGKGCRLHRSRVFRTAGHCIDLIGQDCSAEWCDVSVWGKQEVPDGDDSTSFGLIHDPGSKGRRNRIVRCWLHDGPLKVKGDYHKFGITGVGVGDNPRDFGTESYLEVIENLFESCGDCDISIKTSRNLIQGNTITGKGSKSYGNQRSGNYNQWLLNWFEDLAYGLSIVVHGGHHVIAGNHVENPIALRYGNFEWDEMPDGNTRHHRAFAVRLAANDGPAAVYGHRFSGESPKLRKPPKDCVFWRQPYVDKGGATPKEADLSALVAGAARRLSREEVGPFGRVI